VRVVPLRSAADLRDDAGTKTGRGAPTAKHEPTIREPRRARRCRRRLRRSCAASTARSSSKEMPSQSANSPPGSDRTVSLSNYLYQLTRREGGGVISDFGHAKRVSRRNVQDPTNPTRRWSRNQMHNKVVNRLVPILAFAASAATARTPAPENGDVCPGCRDQSAWTSEVRCDIPGGASAWTSVQLVKFHGQCWLLEEHCQESFPCTPRVAVFLQSTESAKVESTGTIGLTGVGGGQFSYQPGSILQIYRDTTGMECGGMVPWNIGATLIFSDESSCAVSEVRIVRLHVLRVGPVQ